MNKIFQTMKKAVDAVKESFRDKTGLGRVFAEAVITALAIHLAAWVATLTVRKLVHIAAHVLVQVAWDLARHGWLG